MENKMKRIQVGMIIAGVATLSTILAFIFYEHEVSTVFLNITSWGALAAYIVGGGIKYGLKCIVGCAGLFRRLCPFYIIDLMFAMVGLCIGLGIFCMLPIIFVVMNYFDLKATMDEPESCVEEVQE